MPDRPILTFDFDGVICRPPLGINPGRNQHKDRGGEGSKNVLWLTERWRYLGRRPMPGARDGFNALAKLYDCRIISARAEAARPLTERWLQRYLGFVPTLLLRTTWHEKPAQFKNRVIAQLGPLAHFEDDAHTAEWLAEILPAVFVVDWARNRWLDSPNVYRIRRLAEAVPILQSLPSIGVKEIARHPPLR